MTTNTILYFIGSAVFSLAASDDTKSKHHLSAATWAIFSIVFMIYGFYLMYKG